MARCKPPTETWSIAVGMTLINAESTGSQQITQVARPWAEPASRAICRKRAPMIPGLNLNNRRLFHRQTAIGGTLFQARWDFAADKH